MKISDKGCSILKEFEGFRADAYQPVPGDRITIGYGFTRGVKLGQHMTKAQADARLPTEVLEYENAVGSGCKVAPTQNQFDAMVCLCYNIGVPAFLGIDRPKPSTVLVAHNRGDFQSAARAFGLWNKSSGVVYPGLTRRRAAESALYLTPEDDSVVEQPMPQTVDAESSLTTSPINRSAVVAGVTTGAATITQILTSISETGTAATKAFSDGGSALLIVLGVVAVLSAGYVVWNRWQQRKTGWV